MQDHTRSRSLCSKIHSPACWLLTWPMIDSLKVIRIAFKLLQDQALETSDKASSRSNENVWISSLVKMEGVKSSSFFGFCCNNVPSCQKESRGNEGCYGPTAISLIHSFEAFTYVTGKGKFVIYSLVKCNVHYSYFYYIRRCRVISITPTFTTYEGVG